MRDVLDDLSRWWKAGETAGLALVTATWSSAPRPPGAAMLVGPDGTVTGSVSGGCVDAAVYDLCRQAAKDGQARTVRYGVSDDDALGVGLTCGGTIELIVLPVSAATLPDLPRLAAAVEAGEPVALLTRLDASALKLVLTMDDRLGSLGPDRVDDAATDDGRGLLAAGRTAVLHYGPHGERRGIGLDVLVSSFAPAARMIVFGGTDHAAAVARIGAFLGYRVTVCDARPVFATARRFPDAHDVVVDWPHRYLADEAAGGRLDQRTVVCVLTHDPKFDVPVLRVALKLDLGYVGAMGSRRTHDRRLDRLRADGLDDVAVSRLASPIGLDLGARTPEETAVSIAAEIVALRWGGSGERLSATTGRIHTLPPG
jgi:xanthine dehydrogenase accessory factor